MSCSWIRALAGTIASAGTTTGKPTPALSSGTEAVRGTGTALTQKKSAKRHVLLCEQVKHTLELNFSLVNITDTENGHQLFPYSHILHSFLCI